MLFGGEVMFILFLGLLSSAIMLQIRNNWVYNKRIELLHKGMDKYKLLPSYDTMMYKFWIWNIDKFIEEK